MGSAYKDAFGLVPGTHLASPMNWRFPVAAKWATSQVYEKHGEADGSDGICTMYHHGVYLGEGMVMGFPEGLGTLKEFAPDGTFYTVSYAYDKQTAFKRAVLTASWEMPTYDPMHNNCEHFVTMLTTGRASSLQALRAKMVLRAVAVGSSAVALARAAKAKREARLVKRWGFKPGAPHTSHDARLAKHVTDLGLDWRTRLSKDHEVYKAHAAALRTRY